jgi:hypothetical protein
MNKDMTVDCPCGFLLFPTSLVEKGVLYECANGDTLVMPLPDDEPGRRLVRNWIDKRSAQIDTQHRRREP